MSGSNNRKDVSVQTAIAHLKYDNNDNWQKILESWSVTHALRISERENKTSQNNQAQNSITDYINVWAVFSLPNGYLLVSIVKF